MPYVLQWWRDGTIPQRITSDAVVVITSEPAILVHAMLVSGPFGTARMDIYNQKDAPIDDLKRVAVILVPGVSDNDRLSNVPIRCDAGIIAQMNANGAEGYIYYSPLPSSHET